MNDSHDVIADVRESLVVLTHDGELLQTIRAVATDHDISTLGAESDLAAHLLDDHAGVAVIDTACVTTPINQLCDRLKSQFPDLVLEIVLTSGGVNKLEIYARFKVPEVWFWRRNKLEIFALDSSGRYERLATSRLLPDLDIQLLEHCVGLHSWQQARQTFRAGLLKSK